MQTDRDEDEYFMREALREASKALEANEVPIGAVTVCGGRIAGRGHNLVETLADATAHAEMQAITAATQYTGGKYLNHCTLYVTVEPCPMCASASAWSHIGRIVFGAADPKRGYTTVSSGLLHPKTEVTGGILENECRRLMESFFKKLRPTHCKNEPNV